MAQIEQFVKLAWMRRKGHLSSERRPEFDALGEALKMALDRGGASGEASGPAPRVGASDSSVDIRPPPDVRAAAAKAVSASAAGHSTAPRAGPSTASDPSPATPEPSPTDRVELPDSVRTVEVPASSSYTPSAQPVFMDDYFGDDDPSPPDWSEETTATETVPVSPPVPKPEVTDLHSPSPSASASASADERRAPNPPAAESKVSASQSRRQMLVHLQDGTVVRGRAADWSLVGNSVVLEGKAGSTTVELSKVLVIFLGSHPLGGEAAPENPRRLKVRLSNGKKLVGTTDDYEEGKDRFTLVPEGKSKGVDRVWIPAWSVTSVSPVE